MKTVFLAMGFAMLGFNVAVPWLSYTLDQWMGVEMCKLACLGRNHCVAVNYTETDGICEIIINADTLRNQEPATNMFTRKELKGMKIQGDTHSRGAFRCQNQDVCIASRKRSLVCVDPTHIEKENKRKLIRPEMTFSKYNTKSCIVDEHEASFTKHGQSTCLAHSSGGFNDDGYYYWTISIIVHPQVRETLQSQWRMGPLNGSQGNGFTFHFENTNHNQQKSTSKVKEGDGIKITLFKFHTNLYVREYTARRDQTSLGFYIDVASGQFVVVNPHQDIILGSVQVKSREDIHFKMEFPVSASASCKFLTGVTDSNKPPLSLLEMTQLTLQ